MYCSSGRLTNCFVSMVPTFTASSLPTLDHPARSGTTFPNPRDEVCTWRDTAQLAKTGGVLTSVVVAMHRELSQTLTHAQPKRRICEPRDADDAVECGL